jgi:hypothetical protein
MTSVPETTSNTAAPVRFLTVELPELLGITGTVHAATLEALAAVLGNEHVFDDLLEKDAKRVAARDTLGRVERSVLLYSD